MIAAVARWTPRLGGVVAGLLAVDALVRPGRGDAARAPDPAGAAVCLGLALALVLVAAPGTAQRFGRVVAAGAAALAGLALIAALAGVELARGARTEPHAALAWILLASSILVLEISLPSRVRPAELCAFLAGTLGLYALVEALYGTVMGPPAQVMAPGMGLAVVALAAGVLGARAPVGVLAHLLGPGPGGRFARALLPAALVLPVFMGWLRLEGQQHDLIDTATGVSLLVVAMVAVIAALVAWHVRAIDTASADLREANRLLDAIVENLPDMVFVKDGERLGFVRMNRAGEELLGRRREDLLGKTDYDLFDAEQARSFQQQDRQALAGLKLVDVVAEPITTAQGERWLHTRKVAIAGEAGRPGYLLGISEDITSRRAAERELKRSEEELRRAKEAAEATSRELESFSYSVSHDLRTPLRAIDGFSQALAEDYGDRLDDAGRDHLRRVRAAAQRMARLIDDLLQLSRVARVELVRERVDLGALGREVAAELVQAQPGRQVVFTVAEELGAEGDPRLLRLVLQNLLENAWKFTARRPEAHVELGRGADGELIVRDDGVGFDMGHAQKLFGPFQRLHATTDFPGTGVGLATVQRIVHRHGGRVWADSSPGAGATFHFTLPLRAHAHV